MHDTIAIAAHLLGLLGMAGVWLVPRRTWMLVLLFRRGFPGQARRRIFWVALVMLAALGVSLLVGASPLPRVFRCLWDGWCTANRGGGLLNLALFGVSVLVVEACWLFCRRPARRWSSSTA